MNNLAPYDALMLVSYGGPDGPSDVLPFLRNATGGAGIPDERLEQVGKHYRLFGGASPINARNAELLTRLRERLGEGLLYAVGNRNWHPYFKETLLDLVDQGARRILTLFTSAYTSYSGCRQYRENLAEALDALSRERPEAAREVVIDRVRPFANIPAFPAANAAAVARAAAELGPETHLVYVTHSIPLDMARNSGPQPRAYTNLKPALFEDRPGPEADLNIRQPELDPSVVQGLSHVTRRQDALGQGWTYLAQHLAVVGAINRRLAEKGRKLPWSLAFCSRSGSPHQTWLEPDINDHLRELAANGVKKVVVCPFGFISDHMEVVYDLDTEAKITAGELGLDYLRAASAEADPEFIDGLAQLIEERAALARFENPTLIVEEGTYPPLAETCGPNCCQYPQRSRLGSLHAPASFAPEGH